MLKCEGSRTNLGLYPQPLSSPNKKILGGAKETCFHTYQCHFDKIHYAKKKNKKKYEEFENLKHIYFVHSVS